MKFFISSVVACIVGCISCVCLHRKLFYRYKLISGKNPVDDENILSYTTIIVGTIIVVVASFFASIKVFSLTSEVLNICKLEIALICLAGSGSVDIREHRIPNFFPAVMAVSGLIILVLGLVLGQNGAVSYVVSSAYATAGTTVALLVARALSRNGVGLGDVKLLAALAVIGGVYTICGTLFYGMCICAVFALAMLLTKKKTINGSLPFGPFIYVGFVLSILTSNI